MKFSTLSIQHSMFGASIALSTLLGTVAFAEAGNPVECAIYANNAVQQQAQNLTNSCGYTGARWGSNTAAHLAWCLNAPSSVVNGEHVARQNMLAACLAGGPGPAPGPAGQAKVCVWDGANYTGASVCVYPGMSDSNLGAAWNDKVTSLKVYNGAKIKLCQNPGYLGFCNTFSTNRPILGNALNNKASSYEVSQ